MKCGNFFHGGTELGTVCNVYVYAVCRLDGSDGRQRNREGERED